MNAFLRSKLEQAATRRNWAALPADFERDAVRALVREYRSSFPRLVVRGRILAEKATTFAELHNAFEVATREYGRLLQRAAARRLREPACQDYGPECCGQCQAKMGDAMRCFRCGHRQDAHAVA